MRTILAGLLGALVLAAPACDGGSAQDVVWFVHATDPHVFLEPDLKGKYKDEEKANSRAFEHLLKTLDYLPGDGRRPQFLLLTGDIGFGERVAANDESRVTRLAGMLAVKPGLMVYWVHGNNDVFEALRAEAVVQGARVLDLAAKRADIELPRPLTSQPLPPHS